MMVPPNAQKPKRSGFTLLEIMIALALMILLVTAVSQAITLYVDLQTFGREEVEQNQIGRAVLERIAKDIRCISFTATSEEDFLSDDMGGSEVGMEDDLGDDTGFEDDMMADEDEEPPVETGILGTSEELILYINRPDRRIEYVSREEAEGPKDRVSDSLTVYYYLCRPGDSGLGGEFARTLSGGTSDRDVLGLARMEGDRQALNKALAKTISLIRSTHQVCSRKKLLPFSFATTAAVNGSKSGTRSIRTPCRRQLKSSCPFRSRTKVKA